jgi:prophage DNA circulation protein
VGVIVLAAAMLTGVTVLRGAVDPPDAQLPEPVRGSVTATPTVLREGWSAQTPTRAAIEAMWEWVMASSDTLDTVTEVTYQVRPQVQSALTARNVEDIRFYCSQMVAPITVEMSAIVDTPDPDLTRAMQTVVDSARDVEARCATLREPPDQDSLDALHAAFGRVAADLDAMVRIVDRDATIMERAGR